MFTTCNFNYIHAIAMPQPSGINPGNLTGVIMEKVREDIVLTNGRSVTVYC
jgi:hypothetical protein